MSIFFFSFCGALIQFDTEKHSINSYVIQSLSQSYTCSLPLQGCLVGPRLLPGVQRSQHIPGHLVGRTALPSHQLLHLSSDRSPLQTCSTGRTRAKRQVMLPEICISYVSASGGRGRGGHFHIPKVWTINKKAFVVTVPLLCVLWHDLCLRNVIIITIKETLDPV